MQRSRRPAGIGVMLLASQLLNVGIFNLPPVTLATIAVQVAIYLRLVNIPWDIDDMCVCSYFVWHKQEWQRLLLAAVGHVDDMHLYYNMVSFLWKGISLERRYGHLRFAVILIVFSVASNCVLVAFDELSSLLTNDDFHMIQCSVGFSGVIFALKVLTTSHMPDAMTNVYGFWVPVKWGVWCELILIGLLVPESSFLGHLAGIFVGLAYTSGPLKKLVNAVCDTLDILDLPLRPDAELR